MVISEEEKLASEVGGYKNNRSDNGNVWGMILFDNKPLNTYEDLAWFFKRWEFTHWFSLQSRNKKKKITLFSAIWQLSDVISILKKAKNLNVLYFADRCAQKQD